MIANYYRLRGVAFDAPLCVWPIGEYVVVQIGRSRPETYDIGGREVGQLYSMAPRPVSKKAYAAAMETGRWLDETPSREQ